MAHILVSIHRMTLMLVLTTSAPTPSPYTQVFAGFTDVASAIGPGESGMTKYEDNVIFGHFQFDGRNGIHFVDPSVPVTATYTIEEGGTVHREVADPLITQSNEEDIFYQDGKRLDCQINDDRSEFRGVCSGEILHPEFTEFLSGTQTVTGTMTITRPTTYTATAFPVATFTTTASSAHGLSASLFSGVVIGVVLRVVMML